MASVRFFLPLVVAAMLPAACGDHHDSSGDSSTDASLHTDASDASDASDGTTADQFTVDSDAMVAPTDGTSGGDAATDGPVVTLAECAAGTVVDLSTRGTFDGTTTHLTLALDSTPATTGLHSPTCQDDVGHVQVFSYTAHGSATLRVSTNNEGTTFDTVVWGLDHCAASGAMELGCGDDDNLGAHDNASTFTTDGHVTAGQTIYLAVAGMGDATGTVELTVAELHDVATGAACDPNGLTTVCATIPATCVTSAGASTCELPRYTESGVEPVVFVDACATGTHVALGGTDRDDAHSAAGIALPFAFHFFGDAVTSLWPSTNGYAVFDAPPTDSAGGDGSIPMPEEGAVVAPFWQNLELRASPGSDVCVATTGAAPSRQLVVEWLDAMPTGDDSTHVTFELVLSEGTDAIDFVYHQLDPGASDEAESDGSWSVIGLQSNHGERFVVHDGSVTTTDGIHFAAGAPTSK